MKKFPYDQIDEKFKRTEFVYSNIDKELYSENFDNFFNTMDRNEIIYLKYISEKNCEGFQTVRMIKLQLNDEIDYSLLKMILKHFYI